MSDRSGDCCPAQSSTSWLPRSNFVDRSTLEIRPSEKFGVTEEVVEKARSRTEEFIEEYPERSRLPLSRNPDESLLSSYVIEEYQEEHVEPEGEFETGFTVERLERAVPVSWAEAFFLTLIDRHQYDGGVSGRFVDHESGDEFNVGFSDAWTADYAKEQQAKMAGAQRQLMGGEYPDHKESARRGELEIGEWDNPVSILAAFTASAMPEGEHCPPVDHAREVDTWGAVYHRVRNLIEHKWGVPSDGWGYMRSEDVHGMGEGETVNAGYTHTHPAVFVDVSQADGLPELPESELEAVIQREFLNDVVSKHVEECDVAEESAHGAESVTVEFGVEQPGAYAAAYALPGEEVELIERSVEYIAWASTMRAMGRQRIARSSLFTEAAKADMCKQSSEQTHGERLEYDRGGHNTKLVCSCCGSSVGVGETMVGHRVDSSRAVATDGGVSGEGETVVVGASVGESTDRARARATAERYVERHGEPDEVSAGLLGEMGVSPEHSGVVCEAVRGEGGPSVEAVEGPARSSESSRYDLQELRAWNGDSETPGEGGGASYSELQLPVRELIRGTRLQHVGEGSRPKIVVSVDGERFATYEPATAARALVNAGLRIPWVADRSLEFEQYDREVFEAPVARPGADDSVQEPGTDEAETAQEHNTS